MAAIAAPVIAWDFIAAAAVMDTVITEAAGRVSVVLVMGMAAATPGVGSSRVMGISSHPSRRTANLSTGKVCPFTIPTMSTMNGMEAPERTRRCNLPPASLSRLPLKHRS
jgi:hypothetical protein